MRNPNINRGKLRPGLYYVGDLCYLDTVDWSAMCKQFFPEDWKEKGQQSGVFTDTKGKIYASYSTACGDGIFADQDGDFYSVDSGSIGCYPVESEDDAPDDAAVYYFDEEFDTDYDEETGVIRIGDIEINTDILWWLTSQTTWLKKNCC